jgi:dynein heavy chain
MIQVKAVVEKEEAEVKKQTADTQLIKDDAQRDLDAAMPALNAAIEALNSLNKSDITEIKSFAKPPPLVQMVMEAVCVLLGEKSDWDTSKKAWSHCLYLSY